MAEERIEVKLVPRPEEVPILCGLTRADERRVNYVHDMVDTLHSLCEERVGMAEQVKPAVSFKIDEACQLRDLMIRHGNKFLGELLGKAKRECP